MRLAMASELRFPHIRGPSWTKKGTLRRARMQVLSTLMPLGSESNVLFLVWHCRMSEMDGSPAFPNCCISNPALDMGRSLIWMPHCTSISTLTRIRRGVWQLCARYSDVLKRAPRTKKSTPRTGPGAVALIDVASRRARSWSAAAYLTDPLLPTTAMGAGIGSGRGRKKLEVCEAGVLTLLPTGRQRWPLVGPICEREGGESLAPRIRG
ncbi:hypothetical protein B0H19DRAFT_1385716 [Mycena capillaripes]|nr:hypothetical protein B0H19DRAFT_1385716 [Mycena capillaripes]